LIARPARRKNTRGPPAGDNPGRARRGGPGSKASPQPPRRDKQPPGGTDSARPSQTLLTKPSSLP